jgi:hypothetical protein
MLKNLRLYYVLVGLPFAALLVGSAIFFEAIKLTITRNPHPQINYTIFVIILFGGLFILINARRLVRQAKILVEFSGALRAKADPAALQELAGTYVGDIASLLQMVAASSGRSISHQEQVAIDHELSNARARLNRRNALPQYLTGLLVGMGLLGTFIGLLATLNDIAVLISSFADLDMKSVDPILVFGTMIERMKAPMQSMGIAFSASLFGLLGSIILGLMMVGLRRLEGDIFSLLSSRVARHVETALANESGVVSSGGGGAVRGGDEYKVLVRIEERLAEAARLQQRSLSAQVEDFQKQRADMLRTLSEQNEASNNFRSELQQLGRQLGEILQIMEKRNAEGFSQLSELTVHLAADARETHKLLTRQVEEQQALRGALDDHNTRLTAHLAGEARETHKLLAAQVAEQTRLRDALDGYNIGERLAEAARLQQRTLTAEIEGFQQQRADMLRTISEQTEASNNFRGELQQLGRQLGDLSQLMERGNDEVRAQVSELMVHLAADAKEAHRLLAMQVNEQLRLRDSLDLRVKSTSAQTEAIS